MLLFDLEQVLTFIQLPQTIRVFLAGTSSPSNHPFTEIFIHDRVAGRHDTYQKMVAELGKDQLLGKLVLLGQDSLSDASPINLQVLKTGRLFYQHDLPAMSQTSPLTITTNGNGTSSGDSISPESPLAHTAINGHIGQVPRAINPKVVSSGDPGFSRVVTSVGPQPLHKRSSICALRLTPV